MGNEESQPMKLGEPVENDIEITWERGRDCPFPPREGHCATFVDGTLYIFGGVTISGDGCEESNDLLTYDIDKDEWQKVDCKGTIPCSRMSAVMSTVNKNVYLFGGLNNTVGWLNDVHIFNTVTREWCKIEAGGIPPSPRDKSACTAISENIYFFGGFGPKNEELPDIVEDDEEDDDEEYESDEEDGAQFGWFNDLFVFDTTNNKWSNPMQMNLGVPTQRAAHGMCAVGKNILIFGGRDTESRRNDLHIFDTESRKWFTELNKEITGERPEARSFLSAASVDQRMVVFGGRGLSNQHFDDLHIFDLESKVWLQPHVKGTLPHTRGCHTATLVQDKLVIFGGSSDFNTELNICNKLYNDVHFVRVCDVKQGKSLTSSENYQEDVEKTSNGDSLQVAKVVVEV